ncbi:MAG: 16S rRNA (adenine(1518)-N(6)/adenine(1519)-N(6))-dimethyltransferase RsmA [Gammaproteobacteria bacterium]|nr:16S rRNA (adenine(1518)-N(6)/adenine(1519)-N(6))-dimethyltransferase RsmA [Gammaproteobacteria bacterium]MBU1602513.1 16S rRNA (adenine(1518)-N(6)/adenine(1519)-N(6))-dimethyltransferase RsmA [Gammaproteobacteria bacterium]MBU2433318.1 16S rRNA (adenine(1518)-N(6)/adenine(1519)-N(6))-dimethyltransferase RsmA [Gammaproteobacteria bacterium]MBU2451234.1 16S rRNA (adenine(1518)-N(6)/adenine(1519)-N(6))-dimethyltransferase RsmA [Gammaproteobacteria bacterium]
MKGHVARKRFGQNFLVDHGVIAAIVSAINPKRDDVVVEIGPGLGAITEPLMQRVDHLHVVEIDRDLIARLKKQHTPERMTIHEGDALAFDFASIGKNLRLVGNLPYNISTPLLFHLADYVDVLHDMHFMLQKEVVERMVAEPGNADFGRMSVMLQYRFYLEWLIDVPPESFDPPPKVQSAVVRLIPKPVSELNAKSQEKLSQVVLTAFSQRRKMLRNTMKGMLSDAGFAELGIAPTLRPEDVSVEDYVRIANYLSAGA